MQTKHAACHTAKFSSVIDRSCRPQMHTRLNYTVMTLPHCIQVPELLWADEWHFRPEGFDVFSESFAKNLVSHLRERGIEVEGSGLRSRVCVRGTRAETRQAHDWATHVRGADNECLMIDCDLKRVRARRDIWCTAAEYARASTDL
jgi:hypothetical protein